MRAPASREMEIDQEGPGHAESGQQLGADVDDVQGFGCSGVDRIQRRGQQRGPAVPPPLAGQVHQPEKEQEHSDAQQDQHRQLRSVELPRLQAGSERVVDRERGGDQRPILGIDRVAAVGARVAKEPGDVLQAAEVEVAFNDVIVIEMERVLERVRVGTHDHRQGEDAGGGEHPGGEAPIHCRLFKPTRPEASKNGRAGRLPRQVRGGGRFNGAAAGARGRPSRRP